MLKPHQERVVAEKNELDDKIGKLMTFCAGNPVFVELRTAEKSRLHRQLVLMQLYSETLGQRIAAFQFEH